MPSDNEVSLIMEELGILYTRERVQPKTGAHYVEAVLKPSNGSQAHIFGADFSDLVKKVSEYRQLPPPPDGMPF